MRSHPVTRSGEVAAFDAEVGLGTVRTDDGGELAFQCTQIADGSRSIAVGTPVAFEVRAGHHGRWEAAALRPTVTDPGAQSGGGPSAAEREIST